MGERGVTYRLEQVFVNSTLQTTYGYHANGARTTKTQSSATSGAYDNQDRIETWGTLAFTHTANGERLTKTDTAISQTTTYTYDALGNLTQAVLPGGPTIDYVIDGLNRDRSDPAEPARCRVWALQGTVAYAIGLAVKRRAREHPSP